MIKELSTEFKTALLNIGDQLRREVKKEGFDENEIANICVSGDGFLYISASGYGDAVRNQEGSWRVDFHKKEERQDDGEQNAD